MFLNIKLLKNEEIMLEKQNVPYHQENNVIEFNLENFSHQIDLEHQIFKRESNEFCFMIDFLEEKCTYTLKEITGNFDIIVDDFFWELSENTLEIHYVIETEDEKSKIIINFLK